MKVPFCTDCDAWLGPLEADRMLDSLPPHEVSAAYFFGPSSELAAETISTPRLVEDLPWIDSYTYEALVVGLFVLACYLLYRYRSSFGILFKMQTHRVPLDKVYEEQTLFFKNFLRLAVGLMVLLAVGITIRLGDFWHWSQHGPSLSRWTVNGLVPGALGAFLGVMAYRYLANMLIGSVTQSRSFFDRYRFMNRVYSALSSVLLTPLFLLCALYDGAGARGIIYVMIGLIVLLIGGYLESSYRFFISRNVSILQWILYLCTVEIFPLSLLLFAGLRYAI